MRREQHCVAEDVAGHVADADRGEVLALDVRPQLAEVALDRLPPAPRGDAHLLVVVAGAAAGGERVAEPESVLRGDGVGDVGEGGGAFVRGHDQVRIVAVAAHHVLRREHVRAAEVVGDVEHAAEQRLVALHAFLLERGAVRRRILDHEAALRAHRHDDHVLHVLRFHQAEDLGAEVLAAVGPADAAARHFAGAQVDAFHLRRVDEDLEHRPRQRQLADLLRVELEGEVGLAPCSGARFGRRGAGGRAAGGRSGRRYTLPVVRAQRGLDQRDVQPQDAVLVRIAHVFQRVLDLGADVHRRHLPAARFGGVAEGGIESRGEQLDELPRDRRVVGQRLLDVRVAQGHADLADVLAVGAQHDHLVPLQLRAEDQAIEAVVLRLAVPDADERLLELLLDRAEVVLHAIGGEAEVADAHRMRRAERLHFVRHFVQHLETHVLQARHDLGERHGRAGVDDLAVELPLLAAVAIEIDHQLSAGQDLFDVADVVQRRGGAEALRVGHGERSLVAAMQIDARLFAVMLRQRLQQAIAPGPRGVGQVGLDAFDVDVRHFARRGAHHE